MMNHNRFAAFIVYEFAVAALFLWLFIDPPFQMLGFKLLGFMTALFAPVVVIAWLSDHRRAQLGEKS